MSAPSTSFLPVLSQSDIEQAAQASPAQRPVESHSTADRSDRSSYNKVIRHKPTSPQKTNVDCNKSSLTYRKNYMMSDYWQPLDSFLE